MDFGAAMILGFPLWRRSWIRRPWNLSRTGKAMFFLDPHIPMRWFPAAWFVIFNRDKRKICAECFKHNLSFFTAPHFYNVLMHICIFILSGTDGNRLPRDLDTATLASGFCPV